jgi:hypothetical protein
MIGWLKMELNKKLFYALRRPWRKAVVSGGKKIIV